MTNRSPVSSKQNHFFDSQQLDDGDLTTEQNYNNNFQASLINNQIGSGVLPEVLNQNILFNSLLVSGLLDGIAINAQHQPSDNNLGNQLEIELIGSKVAGKKSVKVAIIGLDFQGNLQYDTFTFRFNEKQITKKHYSSILTILFNDLIGTAAQSFNLGGHVVIREAKPYSLSRDPIMVAQDVEPNIFWRDFFVYGTATLQTLLTSALPLFNIDNLNIKTGFLQYTPLLKNDVSTQVGEKFLTTTNNIEKITFLLGVQNTDAGQASNLVWHGDLIISIYPLQSTIDCPTDITPNLAIDFSPSNIPLAQISVNYNTLQAQGITLDGNAQPVDFVFSNTLVANGNNINPNQYYIATLKRSGSADQCDLLIATGNSYSQTSRVSTFNGSIWVDIPEQELWFRVWTDAAKITDGQAYETGHGIMIPKTVIDPLTNITVDYSVGGIQFAGNELFTAVLSADTQLSDVVQDQRTGNPIDSRQQFVPDVKLLNPIDIANLEASTEPFVIGVLTDKNQKSFDAGSATLSAALHSWNFINNQFVIKIIDDITDGYRYDPNVNALVSNFINGDFTNAKIIPDTSAPNTFYRISKSELVSMIYGDVNGDGIVDDQDLTLLNQLVGSDLNISPPVSTSITTDGYTTTVVNGYPTYVSPFVNGVALTWQVIHGSTVVASGSDGILLANPNANNLATFQSASKDFTTVSSLGDCKLVILASASTANVGAFPIFGVNSASNHIININKLYYTSDIMMQVLRADIDGDFIVSSNDGYFLGQYIEKAPPFPASSLPESKIGTKFNVLRITVDPFTYKDQAHTIFERTDDFSATITNRSTALHTTQDIFNNDGYFAAHDFKHSPVSFNIVKQFTWEDDLITVNSDARFVPTVFSSLTGLTKNSCALDGIFYDVFPTAPSFDPGKIDAYIPNSLIIGDGEIYRPDGYFYKVDFEVGTIVLEIPDGLFGVEKTIDIFGDFVADHNQTGTTRLGFPAMRFADCSFAEIDALAKGQIQFTVAVQSFSPNTNGLTTDGYTGIIVDGKMGVAMDYATGMLTLNFTNLYQDSVLSTLNTKVQVNVFLKKGGFNNLPIFVDSTKVQNLLQLVSVFSGAGVNNLSAELVDSNFVEYQAATPGDWAGAPPATIQDALDRIASCLAVLNGTPIP